MSPPSKRRLANSRKSMISHYGAPEVGIQTDRVKQIDQFTQLSQQTECKETQTNFKDKTKKDATTQTTDYFSTHKSNR